MTVAVGPGPELLDDPGAERGRRVHDPIPDCLGTRGVLLGVAGVPLAGVLECRECLPLAVREVLERRRVWRSEGRGEVDPGYVARVLLSDECADARPPVAALRAVALVAEPGHQPGPRGRDPLDVPAPLRRLVAEAIAGKRGAHHMKGVGRVAAVGGGVGQRPEHLQELDYRARPAVSDDEREGVGMWGADVEEMDPEPGDLGAELREGIEACLGGPPVVAVGPVAAEVLHVRERDALGPVLDRLAFRPAGAPKALTKVAELGLGDLD